MKIPEKVIKNILIFLTTVGFIAAAGIALILARGTTLTDNGLSETGTIRLTVNPDSNYEVFLNEQKQTIVSDSIQNVLPGLYELKIVHPGYATWQQKINIRQGLVTDVSAQLFATDLKLEQLTKTNVDMVFFSQNKNAAYYIVKSSDIGNNIGIWRQTLEESNLPLIDESPVKLTNIVPAIEVAVTEGEIKIIPASTGSRMLLLAGQDVYVLDTNRYNEPTAANKLNISYPIDSIEWLQDGQSLLIRSANLVIDYNIANKTSNIVTYRGETAPIYAKVGSEVIYLLDNQLYRYSNNSHALIQLQNVTLPGNITALYSSLESNQQLVMQADANLYFLSISESALVNLGAFNFVSASPSGRNLIVRNGDIFMAIQVDVSVVRNVVETNVEETSIPATINVSSLVWANNSSYFVFTTSDATEKVFSADKSGNNINTILTSQNLTTAPLSLLPDNSGLVAKLLDDVDTAVEERQANLYKVSFVSE